MGKGGGSLYRMGMFGGGRRALRTTMDMWHRRLGHASEEKLCQINFLKNNSFRNIGHLCDSCAKSKLTRQPFPTSVTKKMCVLISCNVTYGGNTELPLFQEQIIF